MRIFEILGSNGIDVYMIGDPKQAIKYPKSFETFVKALSNQTYATILEINNQTRRVPKEILDISNRFCYENQQQESLSEIVGELMYIESVDARYNDLLSSYIEMKQIVCIDEKAGRYSTSSRQKHSFPIDIENMIRESNHKKDKTLFVKAAFIDFTDDIVRINEKEAIKRLVARHSLILEKKHFAQLYELCKKYKKNNVSFIVKSIDSVKGLDADTCVLILSSTTLKYLTKNGLTETNLFNKEWKKIYVALTRAKRRLVLALDHDLFNGADMEAVRDSVRALGFINHV